MTRPTLKEIIEEQENYGGWCTYCEAWTHDCCEPDARKYECPKCGNNTVFGAEELLIMGLVSEGPFDEE
jgi:Zn finger protein HypA/HybF involved in hydrogenase expression